MSAENTIVHLIAGGVAGTAGAMLTCPLEVVKTRLQSSVASFQPPSPVYVPPPVAVGGAGLVSGGATPHCRYSTCPPSVCTQTVRSSQANTAARPGIYTCLRHVVATEGTRALFKGLGPNLIGVAPSRAIYFCAYAQSKLFFNSILKPETPLVHIGSASVAGFTASSLTNPIWVVKTRLQLDEKRVGGLTARQCVRSVYQQDGVVGFYRGITASYYGISETVIHFVIYEAIKAQLREWKSGGGDGGGGGGTPQQGFNFLDFMCAGAVSKTIATFVAYPHEVARTRLRQEGSKYRHFWQTLSLVAAEEGWRGMYRGLATQLLRQIPNTAVMMATYEAVLYAFARFTSPPV